MHNFKDYPELTNNQMQFYYFDSPHKQINEGFIARVEKVHDGDTITVKWSERDFNFPIRFSNTNAPEMNAGGAESRDWLKSIVLGKEVYVKVNPYNRVGKFGRIIGEIFCDGININEASLREMQSVPFGQEMPW